MPVAGSKNPGDRRRPFPDEGDAAEIAGDVQTDHPAFGGRWGERRSFRQDADTISPRAGLPLADSRVSLSVPRLLFPKEPGDPPREEPKPRHGQARKANSSPAMRQHQKLREEAGDAILFFRMGDFYEMFGEDARVAGDVLDLAVTSRQRDDDGKPIPMAGFPHHALDGYLGRLVRAGHRVAICEQVESADASRGIVRREIVRVATPSTWLDSDEEDRDGAYLMAVAEIGPAGSRRLGAAWVDLSTAHFVAADFGVSGTSACAEAFSSFRPRELLIAEGQSVDSLTRELGELPLVTTRPPFWFQPRQAAEALGRQFGTVSLEPFGIADSPAAVGAAGAAVRYLEETQRSQLRHLTSIKRFDTTGCLLLDPVTRRHLELFESLSGRGSSLIDVVDRTRTRMGGRLLRRRLSQPLRDRSAIVARHDAAAELVTKSEVRAAARDRMRDSADLERLASRVSLRLAGPREYLRIATALATIRAVRELLGDAVSPLLEDIRGRLDDLPTIRDRIEQTIDEDAPVLARDPGVIRGGVSESLDSLRELRRESRQAISAIETRERQRTGIPSLKIRHSHTFGFTIEVGKSWTSRVPEDYVRRQTLVQAERYVTEELKQFEARLAGANDRIAEEEAELFRDLEEEVATACPEILASAAALAEADVALGLAELAARGRYCRPEMHEGFEIEILGGRHPVVEALSEESFVPNDLRLDENGFLMLLTGPNMGGKSTYLRQAALLVILAQAGSLTPAGSARLPLVDRVFARVGASDDLARGRSTFLTEMEETAHILHQATRKSLVLLDEVGRGTATWDGLSLAWAVAEYIVRNPALRMKTLFATHYHELTELADIETAAVNFHMKAEEQENEIAFLRQVAPGGTNRSYGIQVAQIAGMPQPVIERAAGILNRLTRHEAPVRSPAEAPLPAPPPVPLDQGLEEAAEILKTLDPDTLSAREALALLYRLHETVRKGRESA